MLDAGLIRIAKPGQALARQPLLQGLEGRSEPPKLRRGRMVLLKQTLALRWAPARH